MRYLSFLLIAVVGLGFTGCKKKGCTDSTATNYDSKAKKDDGSCTYATPSPAKPSAPSTYTFTRDNKSTVSFSGQVTRMDMLSEMVTYLKTANTPGTALDEDKLKNMYANENSPFTNGDLNSSTKNLKSKTAGGDQSIQGVYENYFKAIAAISATTVSGKFEGEKGKAGVIQSGTKQYLFNELGQEYTQLIEKGLMGAVMMHQISHVYLGEGKMNVDNEKVVEGKSYTTMEHHWDEAFGYMFGTVDFPAQGTDRFWGKYCNKRDDALGSNKKIMDAFINGRHAITQKDLTARDENIAIIREELEKVCAGTAIHYLKASKDELANDVLRNHTMSEAIAFMGNLLYAKDGKVSKAQIGAMQAKLGSDFYAVDAAKITEVIDELVTAYGFESVKDKL